MISPSFQRTVPRQEFISRRRVERQAPFRNAIPQIPGPSPPPPRRLRIAIGIEKFLSGTSRLSFHLLMIELSAARGLCFECLASLDTGATMPFYAFSVHRGIFISYYRLYLRCQVARSLYDFCHEWVYFDADIDFRLPLLAASKPAFWYFMRYLSRRVAGPRCFSRLLFEADVLTLID